MTDNSNQLIAILEIGFYVCLAMGFVFLIISVILFFMLDIKHIFLMRTGKAAKKDIKRMSEENFNTGQLSRFGTRRYRPTSFDATSSDLSRTEKIAKNKGGATVDGQITTVLNEEATTVLSQEGTTVLNSFNGGITQNSLREKKILKGRFELVKEVMIINTDEEL